MRNMTTSAIMISAVLAAGFSPPARAQGGAPGAPELARLAFFGTGAPEGTVALFGHGFPKGTLQKTDAVAARLTDGGRMLEAQMNPVTSWPDGSVKVALLAVAVPALAQGATGEYVLVRSAAGVAPAAPLDLAAALRGRAANLIVTPVNGAPWTFDLLAAARAPENRDRWHDGPLAVSTRVETKVPNNVVGVTSLRLVADVIVTRDGILEVDTRLANDIVMKVGGGHATYGYKVTIDGHDVYVQAPERHNQYTAWLRRNGRAKEGPMPARPLARPDYDVLVKGGFTLPWDRALPTAFFDGWITRSINDWKNRSNTGYPGWGITFAGGASGGRQEIGYRTFASMCWIKSGHPDAQFLAQRQLEVGMSIPKNFWDEEGGTWMTRVDWPLFRRRAAPKTQPAGTPRAEALGYPADQPIEGGRDRPTTDHAHNADYWSVVALLSGRRMAFDGLAMNAAWQSISAGGGHQVPGPDGKRDPKPNYLNGNNWAPAVGAPQIRGFAWGIRDVSLAAALLPDNYPRREYYNQNALAWINSYGTQLPALKAERGELAGWVPHTNGRKYASGFMSSFIIYAILDAMNMGVAGPNGQAVLEYLAGYRINAFNSPDFNWRNAASGGGIHVGDGKTLFTKWSQAQAAHVAAGFDVPPTWTKHGEGDWQRNVLAGLALLRDAPLPLAMRARAANAMVLFRSERQVGGPDRHPRIEPHHFFGPFENLNSLCPHGSTWRWDVPPVVRAGQSFSVAAGAPVGTLVGLVITDGGLPRASKAEGTDSFVIAEQPAGNPLAVSRGGALKLAGELPPGEHVVRMYATTYDERNREHRGPTVEVVVRQAAASAPENVLDWVRDTRIPVAQRQRKLEEIGRRRDPGALAALRAVGDARVYLNFAAVEAIGNLGHSPERAAAAEYLKGRLSDPDSQIATAAIRGYTRLLGEEAVPNLTASLESNRERPDGHQEIVRTAAVEALRDICCPAAAPALVAELERSEEMGWSLEYGSSVLAALRVTGTPEGKRGAGAYAGRLAARLPEDPMARAYFETKIAEANEVAGL